MASPMWLQVGRDTGAAHAIEITEPLLIGRDDRCDLVLDDEKVSRRHALVTPERDGTATLRDLDSASGSFVDGRPVDAVISLVGGEELQFGNTSVRVLSNDPRGTVDERPADPRLGRT